MCPVLCEQEGEDAAQFANRVKSAIAHQGGLLDLPWWGSPPSCPPFWPLKMQPQQTALRINETKLCCFIISSRDGGLKRQKVKDSYKEEQQKMYSSIIVGQNGSSPNSCWEHTEDAGDSGLSPWPHRCWCDCKLRTIFTFLFEFFWRTSLKKTNKQECTSVRRQQGAAYDNTILFILFIFPTNVTLCVKYLNHLYDEVSCSFSCLNFCFWKMSSIDFSILFLSSILFLHWGLKHDRRRMAAVGGTHGTVNNLHTWVLEAVHVV